MKRATPWVALAVAAVTARTAALERLLARIALRARVTACGNNGKDEDCGDSDAHERTPLRMHGRRTPPRLLKRGSFYGRIVARGHLGGLSASGAGLTTPGLNNQSFIRPHV